MSWTVVDLCPAVLHRTISALFFCVSVRGRKPTVLRPPLNPASHNGRSPNHCALLTFFLPGRCRRCCPFLPRSNLKVHARGRGGTLIVEMLGAVRESRAGWIVYMIDVLCVCCAVKPQNVTIKSKTGKQCRAARGEKATNLSKLPACHCRSVTRRCHPTPEGSQRAGLGVAKSPRAKRSREEEASREAHQTVEQGWRSIETPDDAFSTFL